MLIEANALLLADIPGADALSSASTAQSYAFDARNSSIAQARAPPDMVVVRRQRALLAVARAPPPPTPAAAPARRRRRRSPTSAACSSASTTRFAQAARRADAPRASPTSAIGYFTTERFDFTTDTPLIADAVDYVNRWRLEKKDPAAALSEPKQPIVFWLDRNVPEKYRPPIRDGILEWNKAFERIGFKDAIRVEGPARRRRLRHLDAAPRVGALDDGRAHVVRRDRPVGGRSAHRRDPRRRHRHRRRTTCASRALAARSTCRRAGAARRARRCRARRRTALSARTPTYAPSETRLRARRCSKRAAISTPDSPDAERVRRWRSSRTS